MFEQGYVIRFIKGRVRAVLKLLFNIDTESPTVELLENKEENVFNRILITFLDLGGKCDVKNQICKIRR